jgi:hypothetical protein
VQRIAVALFERPEREARGIEGERDDRLHKPRGYQACGSEGQSGAVIEPR